MVGPFVPFAAIPSSIMALMGGLAKSLSMSTTRLEKPINYKRSWQRWQGRAMSRETMCRYTLVGRLSHGYRLVFQPTLSYTLSSSASSRNLAGSQSVRIRIPTRRPSRFPSSIRCDLDAFPGARPAPSPSEHGSQDCCGRQLANWPVQDGRNRQGGQLHPPENDQLGDGQQSAQRDSICLHGDGASVWWLSHHQACAGTCVCRVTLQQRGYGAAQHTGCCSQTAVMTMTWALPFEFQQDNDASVKLRASIIVSPKTELHKPTEHKHGIHSAKKHPQTAE